MTAVDTNILFYAHDSRHPDKQRTAAELIGSLTDGTLLWQVGCEYLWASRKLEEQGYRYSDAFVDIQDLRRVWYSVLPLWEAVNPSHEHAPPGGDDHSLRVTRALRSSALTSGNLSRPETLRIYPHGANCN